MAHRTVTDTYGAEYKQRVLHDGRIDPETVRAHLALLHESGVPLTRVAELAGVDYSGLHRLYSRGVSRITRRVAHAVLAVGPDDAIDTGRVPFARLEAATRRLEAKGWTRHQIAVAVGWRHFPSVSQRGAKRVTLRTLRLVTSLESQPAKAYGRTVVDRTEADAQRERDMQRKRTWREETGVARIVAAPEPGRWRRRSACRDRDLTWLFFSTKRWDVRRAKTICESCPVRAECLEWVLAQRTVDDFYGTCAGTSEPERVELRKRRTA